MSKHGYNNNNYIVYVLRFFYMSLLRLKTVGNSKYVLKILVFFAEYYNKNIS